MKIKSELIHILGIFIISCILVSNLFLASARPATFDGPIHQILIAQYTLALKDFEIPVRWSYGYGNYGMPMPIILHQTTSYLGALINLVTHDVLLSYNLVFFIGAFLSTLFFYVFLRFYVKPNVAFLGAFLFSFAPYRILNIYIRGALPEFFASVFIALILIAVYIIIYRHKNWGLVLLICASSLLFLTHPFTFAISMILVVPYFVINILKQKSSPKTVLLSGFSVLLGISLASFYSFPLFVEIKYFYYGLSNNQLASGHFMGLLNYFTSTWTYFSDQEIYTRPHVLMTGLPETLILILGVLFYVFRRKLFADESRKLLLSVIIASVVLIFFTTEYANFLYQHFSLLSKIQHPWRMLSSLIFISPITIALLISLIKKNQFIVISVLVVYISLIRFPQIYSKNAIIVPQSDYYFIKINPDSESFNTIWTGPTESYPVKKNKGEIIGGTGKVTNSVIKNSKRLYTVEAHTPIRMADYTFYFPGWHVYVDGQPTAIEFQDPNYRGVITYSVPAGTHSVKVIFEDTKIRLLGNFITLASCIVFCFFLIMLSIPAKNKRIRKLFSYVKLS